VPRFNGDPEELSWWKTSFYSYVMGLDKELWDILEDGVGDLVIDEEGAVIDRKKHTPEQKKLYKKHHKIRGSLVTAIPKAEYMKMSDKSTAKTMFASVHVSKILRSLPARWRPKVIAFEEAKDLNTLSVEDLVSSLKVHEIGLNEHEPAMKFKSIALPSRGKSSKALKVVESED